jgi:DNA-binding beta-propeller fold protein YncE
MLAGCGGSQPPIAAPGAMPPSTADTQSSPARSARRPRAGAEFAYVANLYSNNVFAYAINASSGALTQVKGSPFAASYGSDSVAVDPTGKFAYVANAGPRSGHDPGNVSGYAINARSGALTQVPGSPLVAGVIPSGVATDPAGKFVYVTNYGSNNVSAFAINARTGALRQVKGSPFKAGFLPNAVAIDPTGKYAYVADFGYNYYYPGDISAYVINTRSGALTKVQGSPFKADYRPDSLAIDPSGKFAYVVNYGSLNVSAYAINANTGALTQLPGSPFGAGLDPFGVAIHPSGTFAYVANSGEDDVSAYTINASSGALTQVRGSPFVAGSIPDAVAIDPAGKFAYVTNEAAGGYGSVSAYTINASTGTLTKVQGSPFAAGDWPVAIATCQVVRGTCIPPPL